MSAAEEHFSALLHSTARAWRLAVDRRLRDLGVSQAGWLAIAMVARTPVPLSQIELAQRVGVEGASMVTMLDRLAREGLVVRVPSAADRRVKHIELTAAGHALYGKVRTQADAVRRELLRDVDPAKLKVATEVLEILHGLLEAKP